MNRADPIDYFQLDHNLLLHKQINTIAAVNSQPIVGHRQSPLTFDPKTLSNEFMREACFVRRLEQARTKRAMYSDGRPNDLLCESLKHQHAFCTSAALRGTPR